MRTANTLFQLLVSRRRSSLQTSDDHKPHRASLGGIGPLHYGSFIRKTAPHSAEAREPLRQAQWGEHELYYVT